MGFSNRLISEYIADTLKERALVYLNGARQVGKSTLARNFLGTKEVNYITFDNSAHLLAAKNDPEQFVKSLPKDTLNILDEVQMVPEIYLALKAEIDERRLAGNGKDAFLLTGSANLMAVPELAKALVGRMAVITLLPFSVNEYNKNCENLVRKIFDEEFSMKKYPKFNLVENISNATFPEIALNTKINRKQWFNDYILSIFQRDIQVIGDIRKPQNLIQLLSSFGIRAGNLLNNSLVMSEIGMDNKTYEKYKSFLINTFLIFELQPWAKPNRLNKRFVKSPKLYFNDTNLLLWLLKRDVKDIFEQDKTLMGHIFENFVATEIMKGLCDLPDISVSHFRTSDNKEVDFVLENGNGDTIGIEVKLSGTITQQDFNGLSLLREAVGEKFKKGILLYCGEDCVPFGNNWAVPVGALFG